ncbi:MAG: hypothetical protein DHS20C01_19300 [marine bacterium B5-7]|nr:MAG: hypothetical protein DHS20C01_19300 [marine bacterium B5-7]
MNDKSESVGNPAARICVFERALKARRFQCLHAERAIIAEREEINCDNSYCLQRCRELLETVIDKGRFLNHGRIDIDTMSFAQRFRYEMGALNGLRIIIEDTGHAAINDVNELTSLAEEHFGSLKDLPYGIIIHEVAALHSRRR